MASWRHPNHILDRKERIDADERLRARIMRVRPAIDNGHRDEHTRSAQSGRYSEQLNAKSMAMRDARYGEIEQENARLLKKMSDILTSRPKRETKPTTFSTLNLTARKKEAARITEENRKLLERIHCVKAKFNRKALDEAAAEQEKLVRHVSLFATGRRGDGHTPFQPFRPTSAAGSRRSDSSSAGTSGRAHASNRPQSAQHASLRGLSHSVAGASGTGDLPSPPSSLSLSALPKDGPIEADAIAAPVIPPLPIASLVSNVSSSERLSASSPLPRASLPGFFASLSARSGASAANLSSMPSLLSATSAGAGNTPRLLNFPGFAALASPANTQPLLFTPASGGSGLSFNSSTIAGSTPRPPLFPSAAAGGASTLQLGSGLSALSGSPSLSAVPFSVPSLNLAIAGGGSREGSKSMPCALDSRGSSAPPLPAQPALLTPGVLPTATAITAAEGLPAAANIRSFLDRLTESVAAAGGRHAPGAVVSAESASAAAALPVKASATEGVPSKADGSPVTVVAVTEKGPTVLPYNEATDVPAVASSPAAVKMVSAHLPGLIPTMPVAVIPDSNLSISEQQHGHNHAVDEDADLGIMPDDDDNVSEVPPEEGLDQPSVLLAHEPMLAQHSTRVPSAGSSNSSSISKRKNSQDRALGDEDAGSIIRALSAGKSRSTAAEAASVMPLSELDDDTLAALPRPRTAESQQGLRPQSGCTVESSISGESRPGSGGRGRPGSAKRSSSVRQQSSKLERVT